jgi:hypothetical protein
VPTISEKADYVRSSSRTRSHRRHWPGCTKQVPPAMWGCKGHWYKLPQALRNKIWARGQRAGRRPLQFRRPDRGSQVRTRLTAGGRWIRTLGSAMRSHRRQRDLGVTPPPGGAGRSAELGRKHELLLSCAELNVRIHSPPGRVTRSTVFRLLWSGGRFGRVRWLIVASPLIPLPAFCSSVFGGSRSP